MQRRPLIPQTTHIANSLQNLAPRHSHPPAQHDTTKTPKTRYKKVTDPTAIKKYPPPVTLLCELGRFVGSGALVWVDVFVPVSVARDVAVGRTDDAVGMGCAEGVGSGRSDGVGAVPSTHTSEAQACKRRFEPS
jgi:hypothetical protein